MHEAEDQVVEALSVRLLTTRHHGEHTALLSVHGEIDLGTAPVLRNVLLEVLEHNGPVVVDLSDVPFTDSAGVHVLAEMLRRLESQNRPLTIVCREGGQVHGVLALVGLLDCLPVYGSRESAMLAGDDVLRSEPGGNTWPSDARVLTPSLLQAWHTTPLPTRAAPDAGHRATARHITATTHLPEPSREDRDTTAELLRRWHDDADRVARNALVDRFMPLARRLANRYRSPHEPIDDLVQVAAVGLLGAINRFDPDRGIPFPSFAIPTILGELKRYFRNTGWSAHVPRGAKEMALQVARATEEITSQSGRQPRLHELAEYLELSPEDIVTALDAGNAHYAASLDAPLTSADPDDPQTLIETISHTDGGYGLVETAVSLSVAITRLPYLERRAIQMRLTEDLRQQDIAAKLGCSQMQVSRLLRRATAHLREMMDPPKVGTIPASVSPLVSEDRFTPNKVAPQRLCA